jgi:hypothetical protein
MNRTQGGLHVFGNVLPATAEANREKGGLRYDEFLRSRGERFKSIAHLTSEQREAAIERIKSFMKSARPDGLLEAHPELLAFYAATYEQAKQLCTETIEQLSALLTKLNVVEEQADTEADSTLQDMPSVEQFELEERNEETLPEPYRTIQEHGSQAGIGAYAQAIFRQLFADGRIVELLPSLLRREDSTQHLKLPYPTLTTRREELPGRYYANPLHHAGTDYYLCNDWYESRRTYLEAWLTGVLTEDRG